MKPTPGTALCGVQLVKTESSPRADDTVSLSSFVFLGSAGSVAL